jgi:hypothetical protein
MSVSADVVIVAALAAAVTSPRVSRLARLLIATFAFACAWLLAAGFEATRAPGWAVLLSGAVIVVSVVAITATLHLWTQADDGGEAGPGDRGAHGGGGPRRRRPDPPHPGGDDSVPSWWPNFERQLALYVAERERAGYLPPVHGDPPLQGHEVGRRGRRRPGPPRRTRSRV